MSRISNDVGQVQQAVSETIGDLARESLTAVVLAGYLFYIDARLTLSCLIVAPLIVYPLVRLGWRVRKTTRRSQEALEHLSHLSAEAFTGHRIVKAFGTEAHETDKFSRAGYELFRTNMKVTAALSSLPPLMELIGGVGMAAALVYGARQVSTHQMTQGAFFSFMAALLLMYGPAKKLSRVNANLQQAIAASERIFEMLDTHTEVKEQPGAPALAPFRSAIEFRDVGFGYEDSPRRILRGVSLTVRAGQMIAIVGRSGAGKTTLVNLLPRFYDVTSGAIPDRRRRHARRDAGVAARADRHRHAGDRAVRRHDRDQHRLRVVEGDARRRSRPRPGRPTPTSSSRRCRKATRR